MKEQMNDNGANTFKKRGGNTIISSSNVLTFSPGINKMRTAGNIFSKIATKEVVYAY